MSHRHTQVRYRVHHGVEEMEDERQVGKEEDEHISNLLRTGLYGRPSLEDMTVVIHFQDMLRLVFLSILNSSPIQASVSLNSIQNTMRDYIALFVDIVDWSWYCATRRAKILDGLFLDYRIYGEANLNLEKGIQTYK